jgi:hypothetical protein
MMISDDQQPESAESPETPAQMERRATREWKFPVMSADVDEPDLNTGDIDETPSHTIRPPHVTSQFDSTHVNNPSIDSTAESRPSTAASTASTTSDYDPFRFDKLTSPWLPDLRETPEYAEYQKSILDGPGPDHEDTIPSWQEEEPAASYDQSAPAPATATRVDDSVPTSPAMTARLTSQKTAPRPAPNNRRPLPFPELRAPSDASLMAGADDTVVAAELDRLLGDFMDALNVTIEAVQNRDVQTRHCRQSTDGGAE